MTIENGKFSSQLVHNPQVGVAKRINKSNLNRIVNELGQNSMDSDLISLLNEYSVRFV